jgi:ABC-type uncharacterized transport system permease subunit
MDPGGELLLNLLVSGIVAGIPLAVIAHKARRSWAIGLLAVVPLGFLIALAILAFGRWPIEGSASSEGNR